jgi:hypothetical protein
MRFRRPLWFLFFGMAARLQLEFKTQKKPGQAGLGL